MRLTYRSIHRSYIQLLLYHAYTFFVVDAPLCYYLVFLVDRGTISA